MFKRIKRPGDVTGIVKEILDEDIEELINLFELDKLVDLNIRTVRECENACPNEFVQAGFELRQPLTNNNDNNDNKDNPSSKNLALFAPHGR